MYPALRERRRVVGQHEQVIFNLTHKVALPPRRLLNPIPFFVGHEGRPGLDLALFIRPSEQIDKFRFLTCPGFPHGDYVETMLPHDACGVIAEARVERCLIRLEDFVDPQLMDHLCLPLITTPTDRLAGISFSAPY